AVGVRLKRRFNHESRHFPVAGSRVFAPRKFAGLAVGPRTFAWATGSHALDRSDVTDSKTFKMGKSQGTPRLFLELPPKVAQRIGADILVRRSIRQFSGRDAFQNHQSHTIIKPGVFRLHGAA